MACFDCPRRHLETDFPQVRPGRGLHGHCSVWTKGPQEVQDLVMQKEGEIEAGTLVVFKGPIVDQDGNIKVADGELLSADVMDSNDWFVTGVIGRPK